MRPGDTPVPIPNTTVKTRSADGTMLETAWESRRVPDILKNNWTIPDYIEWMNIHRSSEHTRDCVLRWLVEDQPDVP